MQEYQNYIKENQSEELPQQENKVEVANSLDKMHITTFDELKTYSQGTVVRFPDFAEGQPFVAKVKRPSMLALAKGGAIPNELLSAATDLFTQGGAAIGGKGKSLTEVLEIVEVIVKATLVEPTYEQIKEAGITLSDEQLMAIFSYTQTGVKALDDFR